MLKRALPAVAVIADAHFHDLEADFGFDRVEVEGRKITMRSWAETRKSTRVFNESADAFLAALAEVRRRGIRHVVLLGDYTDDGQRATTGALRNILDEHSAFGMSFYALPGNHDIFGPQGRHHTKQFLDCAGRGILVTSDVKRAGSGVTVSDRMYCEGYPAGLDPMAGFGYFRKPEYLHWETPFGMSDAAEDREYEVASPDGRNRYNMMDASYLVEPEPGLWLLMIDANVFEPVNGVYEWGDEAAFIDSTSGGWNAMLRCKPFVIPWIADVCARAERLGKTLLAFSHYPVLELFRRCDRRRGGAFRRDQHFPAHTAKGSRTRAAGGRTVAPFQRASSCGRRYAPRQRRPITDECRGPIARRLSAGLQDRPSGRRECCSRDGGIVGITGPSAAPERL